MAMATIVAWQSPVRGQDDEARRDPQRSGQRDSASPRSALERQRRALVLEYVKRHNPQAARLLNQLETNSPTQYRQAIQALEREVDNLRSLEARDPQRYELALRQWRGRTGLEIALAQIARGDASPQQREQLRQLFQEQQELRRQMLENELAALEQRAARMREQLNSLANATDEDRQRQLDEMIRRARLNAQRAGRAAQPGGGRVPPPRSNLDRNDK